MTRIGAGDGRRRSAALALGLVVLLLIAGLAMRTSAHASPSRATTPSATAVPQGFVGVDVDGPLTGQDPPISLAKQLPGMVAAGVQTIRLAFNWAAAEPFSSWSKLPKEDRGQYMDVHGVPVDFSPTDAEVAAAARAHVAVLPTVLYAPPWDGVHNPAGVEYPRRDGPYAAYLTALIGRYGPHGSFWKANPNVPYRPIREWQIWNEPNLLYYWRANFARSYDGLLRASATAVHRADHGAKVVMGALTNRAWKSYAQLYAVDHSIGRSFDIAAVNGFTALPSNVLVYMHYMRNALNRFGGRGKPLLATEVSWPSAVGETKQDYSFNTTEAGQARNIAALLPMIGAQYQALGLVGFDYYTWMGAEAKGDPAFSFAGLLGYSGTRIRDKPALAAFRHGALTLERCARKGRLATSCIH